MTTTSSSRISSMSLLPLSFTSQSLASALDLTCGLLTDRTTPSIPTHRRISLSPTLACASTEPSHWKYVAYVCHLTLQCRAPLFLCGTTHVRRQEFGICYSRGTQLKRAWQACRSLVNRVWLLPTPTNHSYRDVMLIMRCRIIIYVLLADTLHSG